MDDSEKMKIACSQVDAVLNFYNKDLLELVIPKIVIDYIKDNKSDNYEFNITPETFSAELLTEEAVGILLVLYKDYFSDSRQYKLISEWENSERKINIFNYDNTKDDLIMNSITEEKNEVKNHQLAIINHDNIFMKLIKIIFRRKSN